LLLPRSSVLEIGAGVGVTAAALAAAGFHVSALEPDPGMYAVMLSRLALRPDEIPVASPRRLPRPWERVAQRQLGEMRYEHHAAAEPLPDGSWHTHWKFRAMHGDQLLDETTQTFHWRPLSLNDSDNLLRRQGIDIEAEYAGFDKAPFQPNESRVRLVVGRVT
jgi:hypothetical protein